MAEIKSKFTGASVSEYIDSRANEQQRADCRALMALFRKITGGRPRMWGPSIVGYGSFRYTYATGHSGVAPLASFAIRGPKLVVYIDAEEERQKSLLARLGKHKMMKSCLVFKRLDDLDVSVLERLVVNSIATAKRLYG